MFSIIVAIDKFRGIGKAGAIPWHCSADLKHFAGVTTRTGDETKQNAVIMGRKTWESLPEKYRPLPRRLNIVISRNQDLVLPEGVMLASSLDQALRSGDVEERFVIGGGQLFAEAITRPDCDKLYITEIDQAFDCDTFFPEIPKEFIVTEQSDWMEEGEIQYRFVTYRI